MVQHEATRVEQHGVVVERLDQQVVEPDLAELVDQHGGARQGRVAEQVVQQRGLAGTQEAGEDGDRGRSQP